MPRPNPGRTVGSERTLAQRVAYERNARGWTYDQLARQMADVGCPIQGSALYKIEKGEPPRRVTVDELVAFSNVFGLPMSELLIPYQLVLDKAARKLVKEWGASRDALGAATTRLDSAWEGLTEHAQRNPDSVLAIAAALADYARELNYPDPDEAVAYWSSKLEGK